MPVVREIRVTPPTGLTPGGKLSQFQEGTVEDFKAIANQMAHSEVARIKQVALGYWDGARSGRPPGRSRMINTLKADVRVSRTGASLAFSIGNYRQLRFVSRILGSNSDFINAPRRIFPQESPVLRFYMPVLGRVITPPSVVHLGWKRDILVEEFRKSERSFVANTVGRFHERLTRTIEDMDKTVTVSRVRRSR